MDAPKSCCMAGSATLTTVPSINARLEPRMVATSTQAPRVVFALAEEPPRMAASSQGDLPRMDIKEAGARIHSSECRNDCTSDSRARRLVTLFWVDSVNVSCEKISDANSRYTRGAIDTAASAGVRGGLFHSGAAAEGTLSNCSGCRRAAAGICARHPQGGPRSRTGFSGGVAAAAVLGGVGHVLAGFPRESDEHRVPGDRTSGVHGA